MRQNDDELLNQEEFQHWLKIGLGRPFVYARQHDLNIHRDIILDACLHCYSIDFQIEGTRARYMFELVQITADPHFYHKRVTASLAHSEDNVHAVQRFSFVTELALTGDQRAREAIYRNFAPRPQYGATIAQNFVRLDGLPGFLHAAQQLGPLARTMPARANLSSLWSEAVDTFGEQEADTALRQAAAGDGDIRSFQEALQQQLHSLNANDWKRIEALSYAELAREYRGLKFHSFRRWAKQASTTELQKAAEALLNAQDPQDLLANLHIFGHRTFPHHPQPLIHLLDSPDEAVVRAALRALARITHPEIRSLAFRLIAAQSPRRDFAIEMLSRNFEPQDHDTVLAWFDQESDRDTRHYMELDLLTFLKFHPELSLAPRILLALYETGPCSFRRHSAVDDLLKLQALPAALREECRYDANEDVRAASAGL